MQLIGCTFKLIKLYFEPLGNIGYELKNKMVLNQIKYDISFRCQYSEFKVSILEDKDGDSVMVQ